MKFQINDINRVRNLFVSLLALVIILLPSILFPKTLGLLGARLSYEALLSEEEKTAYEWAFANYEAYYISFGEIEHSPDMLCTYDAVWWHLDGLYSIPPSAVSPVVINSINNFIEAGGGLFLSGFAPQYVVDLGLEDTLPQEIYSGLVISGNWGFKQRYPSHVIFRGLSDPFVTLSAGLEVCNNTCCWSDTSSFDGTWLAEGIGSVSNSSVECGEYSSGKGKVVFVGSGAYDWYTNGAENLSRENLTKFTSNILAYLLGNRQIFLGLLGNKTIYENLSDEEKEAYDWAISNYASNYISFNNIINTPSIIDTFNLIWWHYNENTSLPMESSDNAVIDALSSFISEGGGVLLSGFAPQYVVNMGIEDTPPQEISNEPTTSSVWGFTQIDRNHLIFRDMLNPVVTLSANLQVDNNICWWTDPETFDGSWLADLVWPDSVVTIGEYEVGSGKVIVVCSRAFDWYIEDGVNAYRENLELLMGNIFEYMSAPQVELGLVNWWKFDEGDGTTTLESVSSEECYISNNFNKPEWLEGVSGSALRLDGYSTWVTANNDETLQPSEGLTVEAWLAVEAYPSREAGIVSNHAKPSSGYFFGLDRFGRLELGLSLNNIWYTCKSDIFFPKWTWNHVAATFDKLTGLMKIFLNGELIQTTATPNVGLNPALDENIYIGRNNFMEYDNPPVPLSVLNGAVDEIKLYNTALSDSAIAVSYQALQPSSKPDMLVTRNRCSQDLSRPVYHPMPNANWTNEPHGLLYINNRYHIFFQKNPNGPQHELIHWGHLVSSDLVNWEELPYALAPEMGWDNWGIWSGTSADYNGTPVLIYTGVDGVKAGIGIASSHDNLKTFQKYSYNPVIPSCPADQDYMDFRDPFVWFEYGNWYMIVGSGIRDVGGTVLLYRSTNLQDWTYLGPMFIGDKNSSGIFWEMPIMVKIGGKYVLMTVPVGAARVTYWIGTFQNEVFTPDTEVPSYLDLNNGMLSPSPHIDSQGRLVAIGIIPDNRFGSEHLKNGWAHYFSLPRVWTLLEDNHIGQQPLPELESLRGQEWQYQN
ncbi:MAG: hypothetical protein DRP89_03060, partial [Candidatus Neomarinimicrobiota bacterium]